MAPFVNFQNIRVYWLAFVAYWGILLFGYDTGVGGGVVGNVTFQKYFGMWGADQKTKNQKTIDNLSSNVVSVLQAGAFFGALTSAPVSGKYGRKPTLIIFILIFVVGAILTTVATSPTHGLKLIYAGRVISGFGIGGISAVAPAFVSECSPKEVRGRITGIFQIMVATGVMLSYFVNLGVGLHVKGTKLWVIPFGVQLIPGGIMAIGLLTIRESPRYLISVGKNEEAIKNMAYLRRRAVDDPVVIEEIAEIEAAVVEEREARANLGLKEAFFGKGNFIRFFIAFFIFFLQQFAGQNSVNYYAPQIFASIGYTGTKNSLLASGVYGIMKVVATTFFIFFGVESLGRRYSLFISAIGMGTFFYIIGAILKTHPPPAASATTVIDESQIPPASKAMAGMLYIYVIFYSMGWGPLPWVYCADIFPTRTRHYGLTTASASQWLWNFTISKITPTIKTALGWKMFIMFATINVGAMGTMSLLLPETKGRSLEDMDVIFGSITAEERQAHIEAQQRVADQEAHNVVGGGAHDSEGSDKKDSIEKVEKA
ncbi:sugar transporter [Flagelloscypha sp. PMI_526]|nr:sugar transporter [Flagelloscypha sp. PMI_526]